MTAPSVSIAMATFNGALYLERQLTSLAEQTRLPLEVIVNDDRSTDGTLAILNRFADAAPFPVRIEVNPERLGWRGNFMVSSARCAGDLIAFCDQDDDWYPAKLATLVPHFDDPDVLLVFHDADLIDKAGDRYATLWPADQAVGRIPRLSRPTPWSNPLGLTQMFRRSLVRYNDLWVDSVDHFTPTHRAAHDQWFYFLATNLGDIVAVPDRLLGYRQHGSNAVGWEPSHGPGLLNHELERSIGMLRAFVAVLTTAAGREVDSEMGARLTVARKKNQQLLDRMRTRLALHQSSGFLRRLRLTAALLRHRAYDQKTDWGFGRRALVVDATVGLFGGGSG